MGIDNSAMLVARLKRQDLLFRVKVAAMFLCGIPLSLVGPLVLGTIFWMALRLWGFGFDWSLCFWAAAVVVIPLLYRLEARTGGSFLSQAAEDMSPTGPLPPIAMLNFGGVGMLGAALANPRASAAGLTDVFLFGPRMVVSAWRQVRVRRLSAGLDLGRAAAAIQALAAVNAGIPTDQLLATGESQQALSRVLAFLVFFDWIGIAHDGAKVWLLTQARKSLPQ